MRMVQRRAVARLSSRTARQRWSWLILTSIGLWCLVGTPVGAAEVGPDRGFLVIAGGGVRDPAILERFIELAGGVDAPIVVIPTAGEAESYGQYWRGLRAFREAGLTDLTVMHTRDRTESDSASFVEPIRRARGVWFSGGRQWRLADSYLDTRTHDELTALLERGGVIGGSSAGATIQGSYLARGDTASNTVMMGDHERGMSFLRGVAIDQHLLMRNRQFDLIEILEAKPELLGIGIDEDTAIVVMGDRFEVIGQSYVAIYDAGKSLEPRGRFYFLAPGDRFDLAERQALRMAPSPEPFERVKAETWGEGEQ